MKRTGSRPFVNAFRTAFTANLGLKAIAFVAALVLVAYQRSQQDERTRTVPFSVDVQLPEASKRRELMTAIPPSIRVTVQGSLSALDELSKRVGFRVIPGLSERVVYRELFPKGLTLLDLQAIGDTAIPTALKRREPDFVTEADGSRSTLLVPVRSQRGHDLGWIGLTLPAGARMPPAEPIRERIETLSKAAA